MKPRRPLRAALSLALLAGSPGAPASQAAAAVVGGSFSARVPSSAMAGWTPVVGELAIDLQARPELSASPELSRVLADVRFELALDPRSTGALAFLEHLQPELAGDPEGFARLPSTRRAQLLEQAVRETAAELEPRASALLARTRAGGELSPDDQAEARELAAAASYLAPDMAREVRGLASDLKARRLAARGRQLAAAIDANAAVDAELDFLFAGAERLALSRPTLRPSEDRESFARETLAPYAARALDQAAARFEARGLEPSLFYSSILVFHLDIFGRIAGRRLVRAMRAAGDWTPFVSMLSLHAAQGVARTLEEEAAAKVLSRAAADYNLRLPIPAWHPLASHGTVADWLAAEWGEAPLARTNQGIYLFTAFGIPVRADKWFFLIAAVIGLQLGTSFFPGNAPGLSSAVHWGQALAATALFYASLIAHEFGHALTGRLFGVRTREIVLHLLGGVALFDREIRRPGAEFLYAIAGPAVSVLLSIAAFVAALIFFGNPVIGPVLLYLWMMNAILAVFNMIPAFPMDGGRVLRAGMAWLSGDHYLATKIASWIGRGFALLLGALGLISLVSGNPNGLFSLFLAHFIFKAARQGGIHPGTGLVEKRGAR